jgi:hypothetical protein
MRSDASRSSGGWARRTLAVGFRALVALGLVATPATGGRLPRYGGDLRVQIARVPSSLDPLALGDDDGALVASCLYEGLARWGDADLEPDLARQWLRDEDGRRWVFQLRRDVLFHDGSRCDAQAVQQSLVRLADPKQSAYAWMLSDLVGWDDFVTGRTSELEGLVVLDVDQVELHFTNAVTDLPARLAVLLVQPQSPVLGSEAMRQRLAEVFDRSVLVRVALGGDGEPANTLAPGGPRIVASRPAEPPGDLAAQPQHHARIVVPASEPVLRAVGERLQVHLFSLGMNADLESLQDEALVQALTSQSYDVAVLGWTPPQPAAGVLESATRARLLVSSLLQPALGTALPEAWSPTKLAAAKDPDATLLRSDLCIPLVFFHDVWQISASIQNLLPGSTAARLGLASAHLDPTSP